MRLEGDRLKDIIGLIEPIKDPEIGISIVKLRMVESIEEEDGKIKVNVKLTVPGLVSPLALQPLSLSYLFLSISCK